MKKNQTLMKSISTNRMGAPSIRILSNGYRSNRNIRLGMIVPQGKELQILTIRECCD